MTPMPIIEEPDDEGYGARLIINLTALSDNWRMMRDKSKPARCSAVIKADGYGLGAPRVARALYEAGCRDFFVATAREGAQIRHEAPDARIFVMNCILPGIEATCRSADLVPVLASMEHIAQWTAACATNGEHPCALQVDTGMNRLGITIDDAIELSDDVTRPAGFTPVLIMSHLACADQPDHLLNRQQLKRFQRVDDAFEGIESTLSNSPGVFLGHQYLFDLTRPGIALFGGSANGKTVLTKPVVTAEARIISIRQAKRGETVGYGAATRLERDSVIATCSIGYADGYMRSMSGAGVPLRGLKTPGAVGYIGGTKVPILGRVTMDLTMFDVTDVAGGGAKAGDFIELFGNNLPIDDVAASAGTIGYELLTSLGHRYRRHYISEGA